MEICLCLITLLFILPVRGVGGLCLFDDFALLRRPFLLKNLGRVDYFNSKGHDPALI